MKSCDVTIQMKAFCLYLQILFFKILQNEIWKSGRNLPKFYKMKFGNLVEICLWLHLAVKGYWCFTTICHEVIILVYQRAKALIKLLLLGYEHPVFCWLVLKD